MTIVHLDLEEGFFRDAVDVWAGEQCLARMVEATTRMQVGLAGQIVLDVPAGTTLTVRRSEDTIDLTVDPAQPHVGVSVSDGGLVARTAAEPFPRA